MKKLFGVRRGVIIFFHYRNGAVSHLEWKTEANGQKLPWYADQIGTHEINPIGLLRDRQDCDDFMTLLALMHGISMKEIFFRENDKPEKNIHGEGFIAFQFI